MALFKKKIDARMMTTINLTSKENIKREALILANGDIHTAREIYDFLVQDMDDLPTQEPVQPTWSDNAIGTVNNFLSFAKDNQDTIAQVLNLIKGIFTKGGGNVTPLPPIN